MDTLNITTSYNIFRYEMTAVTYTFSNTINGEFRTIELEKHYADPIIFRMSLFNKIPV